MVFFLKLILKSRLIHCFLNFLKCIVFHHGYKIQDTLDVINKGSSEVRYVADLNRQHGTASIKRHGVDIIRTPTSTRNNNICLHFLHIF